MTGQLPRSPRLFAPDDPALVEIERDAEPWTEADAGEGAKLDRSAPAILSGGVPWGAILGASLVGLAVLGAGVWFVSLVSEALARNDVIGWTATVLLTFAGLAASVLLVRDLVGLLRLGRLGRLRKELLLAVAERDVARERAALTRLLGALAQRRDLAWGLARFREHAGDVRDPGDLVRIADREIYAALDGQARRVVLASAKRVSVVTALSPAAVLAVAFVLVENVRVLRALATIYGGRPGLLGVLQLARMVTAHIVATGGVALTDDLLGQFLGHDVLLRLSRRLGEGAFNGAMTARIGAAAIEVTRPVPFVESRPVRVRDFAGELFRSITERAGRAREPRG
jgi:putative membrane protein